MDYPLSDDDWYEDNWEEDDEEAIDPLPEPCASSRVMLVAARFLLFAIGLGIIPINSLVGRLPREAWKFLRISDLYQDMERAS